MRVIKFRAWDADNAAMATWDSLIKEMDNAFEPGKYSLISTILAGNSFNHELMQFTGLTDINGAEIYEGDIVQMEDICPFTAKKQGKRNRAVVFSDGLFTNVYHFHGVTVIGNIYQNKELLK